MSGLVPWARGQGVYSTQAPAYALTRPQEVGLAAPTAPSLRDWWRELREMAPVETPTPVQSAVVGIRQNAEGAAVGALLALIDTDLGGLDLGGRIPIDWVGAALFYVLSIQDAGRQDSLSLDYRAMGQSCTSVAMYRMVHKWRESKKGIPQNIPQMNGDPVLAAGDKSKF
jgi:hypothetical protein